MSGKNRGILFRYELKKIVTNRLTVVMLAVLAAIVLVEGAGFVESGDSKTVRELQRSLNGRLIDDTLLQEMYPVIDDYGVWWNESNAAYERVAYFEKNIIGDGEKLANYTAEEVYEIRQTDMFALMAENHMTDKEMDWWAKREANLEKPFPYVYDGGPLSLSNGLSGICVILLLLAAMCLSTVFAGEHRQRTDQIILSCVNGRKETYFAKLAAGVTFLIGAFLAAFGGLALLIFADKGLDGLDAVVQLEMPFSAYPLTIGQFIAIQFVLILTASVFFAAAAMAFSEIFRNGLAVMGLMVGCYLASQLLWIPARYRVISQLMGWVPTDIVNRWSLMDHRLVGLGGHFLTNFQAAPFLYLALAVILCAAGRAAYCRFQVTGR